METGLRVSAGFTNSRVESMNKITWLSAFLTIVVFAGLTPVTALAADCGN
jgi:hypothetical protein